MVLSSPPGTRSASGLRSVTGLHLLALQESLLCEDMTWLVAGRAYSRLGGLRPGTWDETGAGCWHLHLFLLLDPEPAAQLHLVGFSLHHLHSLIFLLLGSRSMPLCPRLRLLAPEVGAGGRDCGAAAAGIGAESAAAGNPALAITGESPISWKTAVYK